MQGEEERLEMPALPVLMPEALGDPVEPWTTKHSAGLWGQARALKRGHSSLPASQGCRGRD